MKYEGSLSNFLFPQEKLFVLRVELTGTIIHPSYSRQEMEIYMECVENSLIDAHIRCVGRYTVGSSGKPEEELKD